MRKLMMVLGMALMLVPVFAAVAVAEGQLIQCKNVLPCYGSKGDDKINVADGDKLDTANGGKGGDICIVDARREAGTSCASVDVQRP